MSSTRRVVRAFLASPGDLQEERDSIRQQVTEFNQTWGDKFGCQFELLAWEDRGPGFGRPQQLINADVDQCDVFIGLMWKRWGTPPDKAGRFSSGFEEEYERALERRERTDAPEILLFFKSVAAEFTQDPGEDLRRVMDFRRRIETEKKLLFRMFSSMAELEQVFRRCLAEHVMRFGDRLDGHESSIVQAQVHTDRMGGSEDLQVESVGSPLAPEGYEFLVGLVAELGKPNSLERQTSTDIARFRLLSNAISRPGNEQFGLGVHDINIMFAAHVHGTRLGWCEVRYLVRAGFQHLSDENVPLWSWYSALRSDGPRAALAASIIGATDAEKIGAIRVMAALEIPLIDEPDLIERKVILQIWLGDESPVGLRTVALDYLGKCGTPNDLELVSREYDRNDPSTGVKALECMLRIMIRDDRTEDAQKLLLESSSGSLDAELMGSVLGGFESLDESVLRKGLEHSNPGIRGRALRALHSRNMLDQTTAERHAADRDASVRTNAVFVLESMGRFKSALELEEFLRAHPPSVLPGALGTLPQGTLDEVGQSLVHQYRLRALEQLTQDELVRSASGSTIYSNDEYFVMVRRFFRKHAAELRRNVDDHFGAYFEERLRRMDADFGPSARAINLIASTRRMEEWLRKQFTRRGLDILCSMGDVQDLERIRSNLVGGYAGASELDADYIGRFGAWEDIAVLANAKASFYYGLSTHILDSKAFIRAVAKAIHSLRRSGVISNVLCIQMPVAVLEAVIKTCPRSQYTLVSDDVMLELFGNESPAVRRAAVIKAARDLPARRLEVLLVKYLSRSDQRYYNVTHWLDLGVSMSRRDAVRVTSAWGA